MMNKKYLVWGLIGLLFIGTVGCAKHSRKGLPLPARAVESADLPANIYTKPIASEGSLWTDAAELFYGDRRAIRKGDTVTIDIIENTTSQMNANTSASRKTGVKAALPQFLGYMRWLEAKNRYFNVDQGGKPTDTLFEGSLENTFDGKGKSDRSGQITASIGAIVTEVLPNNNLVIQGKREMRVNSELQIITVSGVVRPEDIGPDNRVKSTYLANARIELAGQGVLADKQSPGWFARILDKVWPF